MPPKLNRKRALFVLTKIDEILRCLVGSEMCIRDRYWRLENLSSFDEFLARRFPESRRKAYYLMSIHAVSYTHLTLPTTERV